MWSTKIRNIWDALYPVALYVVVSDCVYMLLTLAIGEDTISPMALQILTALLSSPSIVCPYFSDRRGQSRQSREMRKKKLLRLLLVCAAAVCLSVSLNNLILMTDLKEQSETYQKVNASFFSSTVWVELFGTSVVTPILEEMLYRGLVYNRLKRSGRTGMAIVISGLIFGLIHFNLVQFLYAGLIGIFLAVVYETEGTLLVPVLAHAAANAVAVARVETGFLQGFTEENQFFVPISLCLLAISIIITAYLTKGRLFEKQLKYN